MLMKIARQSLWYRRGTAILTMCALVVSLMLLLGIDHLRLEAKRSFTSTVSGTDLIVGARSGQLNLLLYSVFRLGNATNNMQYQSYQQLTKHPQVAWTIPLALGDSHQGFRVIGTTTDYFKFYRYGESQPLRLAQGEAFAGVYQAVIGAAVAKKLGYNVGQQIILSHGVGAVSFSQHKEHPFTIVGILAATGTPVDQSVHVSLESIEAIHVGWQQGAAPVGKVPTLTAEQLAALQPQTLTAVMVGLKSKVATFAVQRQVNQFKAEPLSAILPGAALAELWQIMAMVENILLVVTALVLVAALLGMATTLLAAMNERSRELAILRAVGARPWQLAWLVQLEVMVYTLVSMLAAFALLTLSLAALQPWLTAQYGILIRVLPWHAHSHWWLIAVATAALLVGSIPAWQAYRRSLAQGLVVRL